MIRAHNFDFFVRGVKHTLVARHLAKSETIDITLNKENFHKTGKTFSDAPSIFPVTRTDDVSGIKAKVDFDEDVGEFFLEINDEPFENFPFLDASFSLDDTQVKIISATVTINEKVISEGGQEWQPGAMQHAIWDQIDEEEKIISLKIEKVQETTSATMNELIGIVAMQDNIPQEGLQELVFNEWYDLSEPLDDSVMQALLNKC